MAEQRDLQSIVANPTAQWTRAPGASDEEMAELVRSAPIRLPVDYLEFLRISNGGHGRLGCSAWRFRVWKAGDVLQWNAKYGRDEYYSDLFLFGACDGNLFAFDLRLEFPWQLIAMDFLDSKRECIRKLAGGFAEFVPLFGRKP